ncbi:universal stress protein [Desulfobacula sp.]|uniref:universal stress protein n=1 Tax=Desulfobacula sp. TaxID=2593537 RepID=UPI0025BDDC45|nr:universal stress protein [Desulfobacula sp.]MBC2705923.1 universal stress protein [Desulfobacula sp.]
MFKKILVPIDVDYPKTSKAVYDNAADIARLSGADIHLVSVMPGFGMPIVASFVTEEMKAEAKNEFAKALKEFIDQNCGDNVIAKVLVGKHYEVILEMADKWGADLIVVYHNHRRKVNEAFSQTCAQKIVKNANCSVLRLRNVLS